MIYVRKISRWKFLNSLKGHTMPLTAGSFWLAVCAPNPSWYRMICLCQQCAAKKITGVGCVTLIYNVHQHLSVPTVPSHQSQLFIWMCEGHIFWWCFQPMAQFSCLFTFYLAAMIFTWGLELTIGWMAFECVSLVCCDQGVAWQLLSMPESEPFFAWAQSLFDYVLLGMYSDIARRFALHVAVFQTLVWRFWATRMFLRLGVPAAAVLMSQGEAAFTCSIFHHCVKFCNLSQDWCWVVQVKQNWHGVEILIDNEYAVLLMVVMKVMVPMTLKMMVDNDEQWWMIFWICLKLLMELVLSQCNFSVQIHWRTMEWMLVKQMVKVTKNTKPSTIRR